MRKSLRHLQSLVLAAGLLAGVALTGPAAHADGIVPPPSPPIHLACLSIPNDEQIAINALGSTVQISGSCFRGTSDYLSVFDQTQGRYLSDGPFGTAVTADSNGNFSVSVPGHCYDHVEAMAYDTGWKSYSNHSTWQLGFLRCFP